MAWDAQTLRVLWLVEPALTERHDVIALHCKGDAPLPLALGT